MELHLCCCVCENIWHLSSFCLVAGMVVRGCAWPCLAILGRATHMPGCTGPCMALQLLVVVVARGGVGGVSARGSGSGSGTGSGSDSRRVEVVVAVGVDAVVVVVEKGCSNSSNSSALILA